MPRYLHLFETVLTSPPDWISYTNMIANKDDMTSMAQKLVDMSLWPKIPNNLYTDYFDMRFVIKAEQTMRQ